MSIKRLKYKNFITNLEITKKYVSISIFNNDKKILNNPKIDRRELNDEEMIERLYDLMKAMFCIYETNKNFRDKRYLYSDLYTFFSKTINTKHFKISYRTNEIERIIYGSYSLFSSSKEEIKKFLQLRVEVKERFDKKPLIYMINFLLNKPMDKEMLIKKTKNSLIKSFGM